MIQQVTGRGHPKRPQILIRRQVDLHMIFPRDGVTYFLQGVKVRSLHVRNPYPFRPHRPQYVLANL